MRADVFALGVAALGVAAAAPAEPIELLPGVRVDREAGWLEFEGEVAIDCHDPDTPTVYLELVACTPDTREHESLVVTKVAPSSIHAGLLALGARPGSPGRVEWDGQTARRVAATGDGLRVELVTTLGGRSRIDRPRSWMRPAGLADASEWRWVFAGSRMVEFRGGPFYDADGTGVVIGLATFGSEVVAPVRVISPEAAIDTPAWIAEADRVPPRGAPVTVRLSLARE